MDATRFRAALASGRPLLLDGGLATELEAAGHDLSDPLWSARLLADDPAAIEAAHLAFLRAGAEIVTSAGYQATFDGFAARGIAADEASRLLRLAVELALRACDRVAAAERRCGRAVRERFVAASAGPYGAMLADGSEYRGRYGRTVAELRAFHRRRLELLAATPADLLALETIPELDEVVALADLVAATPGAAAWIAVTCVDGSRLRGGAPIEEAAAAATRPGIVAFGLNCTAPEHVDELVGRIRSATPLPVVVYPNSGEGWDAAARRWSGTPGARLDRAAVDRWRALGARIVGGCCRVGADGIAAIA